MTSRILIVDDEPLNRYILRIFLISMHYEVIEAEDGKQALQTIEESAIDLILLDVMLPDISGFDVCQKLMQRHHFNVPIIILSANVQKEAIARGLELGVIDYMTKPYDFDLLQVKMELALQQRRASVEEM